MSDDAVKSKAVFFLLFLLLLVLFSAVARAQPACRRQRALEERRGGQLRAASGHGYGVHDVPASYWAARWIELLAAGGVTTGRGGSYCPDLAVSRSHMAVFLTRMFALPLP